MYWHNVVDLPLGWFSELGKPMESSKITTFISLIILFYWFYQYYFLNPLDFRPNLAKDPSRGGMRETLQCDIDLMVKAVVKGEVKWSGVKLYFRSCWQTCLSLYTSPPNYHFDWSLNESLQSKSILTTKNIQINLVTFANSHLTLRCSLHYAQVFEIGDSPDTILTYNIFWHVLALNSSKSINYTY